MAKTINDFVPDQALVEITVSAADVTAIAAFTTAEDIDISGAVRSLLETSPETRSTGETYVTGSNTPILTTSNKKTTSTWALTVVNDLDKGSAGEWGTDNLSAAEILNEFYDANRPISVLAIVPAGSTAGMIKYSLLECRVQERPHQGGSADANAPGELPYTLMVESTTEAVLA